MRELRQLGNELEKKRILFHATPTSRVPRIEKSGINKGGFWKFTPEAINEKGLAKRILHSAATSAEFGAFQKSHETHGYTKSPFAEPLTLLIVDEQKIPRKGEFYPLGTGALDLLHEYQYSHVPVKAILHKIEITKEDIAKANAYADAELEKEPDIFYQQPREHYLSSHLTSTLLNKTWKLLHEKGIVSVKPKKITPRIIENAVLKDDDF